MTPLGDLHVEARRSSAPRASRPSPRVTSADADGVTVEAEGVFIRPRWARD